MPGSAGEQSVQTGGGLHSMTGFASAAGAFDDWRFTLEIRSVNGRGLDMRIRTPDWIDGLEAELRKTVQSSVSRGNVTVSARVAREAIASAASLNDAALSGVLDALKTIHARGKAIGLDIATPDAAQIAGLRGVMEVGDTNVEETKALREAIARQFLELMADFNADRRREGDALASVLAGQLDTIEALQSEAVGHLGDRAEAQRQAMERSLARLLDAAEAPDEARLLQELALIAVKTDVAEELDRLEVHIAAARDLLNGPGPVGRKFDFLMQEFNREANTLCSKAQSAELTGIGLNLKTVIDQMREQVQNLE